jgi:8-amino-7-oxononanoate synthase
MSRFDHLFLQQLDALEAKGQRRRLVPVTPAGSGMSLRDGQTLLNFSSNDYLGLSRHPLLAERARDWGARYGTGSGASRLVCGTLDLHTQVEAKLASLKGTEAALVLAAGWQANASVLPALLRLAGPDAMVFADFLNHSSLAHGCRAAGIKPVRFAHNDMNALAAAMAQRAALPGRRFIVTESVFSMDGDRADLPRLRALADAHDAFLYIDEAHATGVLGPRGMGLCAQAGVVDLAMGTFSKALGGFGAYVAGSRALIDYLTNACAGFVYTTALPPTVLGAMDAALDLVPGMESERAALAANAARVRDAFAALGVDTGGSSTHIVPAMAGDEQTALALAADLRARGILAVAIRPPTVPAGTSRLRFALSAAHTPAAVDQLIASMQASWPALRRAA